MSQIIRLDDHLINQIAAGEVIENPACVFKELVDNCIDAEAKRIVVKIKEGGKELISIEDDGKGMTKEDLALSIERHATSKIRTQEDLFSIQTMGFRGEALASIAAISHLEITTCHKDQAYKLSINGGKNLSIEPSSRQKGTTIKVSSLFFNVPVRKKFQKSTASCTRQIIQTLQLLALANPSIYFELETEERTITYYPAKDIKQRVKDVLGNEFIENGVFFTFQEGPFEITAIISTPENYKSHRKSQHIFINDRPVSCPTASLAIRQGYSTLLPEQAFPLFCLYINLPPQDIDVNVHPQKKEIRLLDEKALFQKLERATFKALNNKVKETAPIKSFAFSKPLQFDLKASIEKERKEALNLSIENKVEGKGFRKENPKGAVPLEPLDFIVEKTLHSRQEEFCLEKQISLKVLFLREKFAFVSRQEEILVIDLQAVFARQLFEQLICQKEVSASQRIFIPKTLCLNLSEKGVLEEESQIFEKLGYEWRFITGDTIAIDAMPSYLSIDKVEKVFLDLVNDLLQGVRQNKDREKFFALISTNIAKRRKTFTEFEARSLITKYSLEENYTYCPLGKKCMIELNPEKLDKLFL